MAAFRIAVIGGDGIGPEVIDQAIRSRRRRPQPRSGRPRMESAALELHSLSKDRANDAARRLGHPSPARRHSSGRHRPSRRARSHHAARPAAAHAPQIRSVRQSPPRLPVRRRPVAAARQGTRFHRHDGLSREHRGRIRADRRPALPGHAARDRHPDEHLHAPRLRAHHARRLRGRRANAARSSRPSPSRTPRRSAWSCGTRPSRT